MALPIPFPLSPPPIVLHLPLLDSLGFIELRTFLQPGTRRVVLSELEWRPCKVPLPLAP
jgi:hypothetical protein